MKVTDFNPDCFATRLQNSQARKDNLSLTNDEKRLMETCRDFESIFLGELISSMRKTIPKNGLLGNSFGQDVFQSMLDDEYAKQMALSRSTGLAEILFQQLRPDLTTRTKSS